MRAQIVAAVLTLWGSVPVVAEEGFREIFDGKSLEGWKCRPESRAGDWSVTDGKVVGIGGGHESYLMFEDELGDFELKFSYRLLTKGNTGLEVRGRPVEGKASRLHGYHADIGHVGIGDKVLGAWDFHENNRGDYLAKRGERVTIGEDGGKQREPIAGAMELKDVKRGDWNAVHVVAQGNRMWFSINGKIASEVIDNEPAKRLASGFIGFQLHGGDKMVVEFKDIALKKGGARGAASGKFELRENEVVAFVGGTDLVRMQQDGRLETAMTMRWREVEPKFRDFAWEGDTVYFQTTMRERWRRDAFGGWKEQMGRVNATVVITQFGKMESLDGAGKLGDFRESYGNLLDELGKDGRRVVMLAPSPFEWEGVEERSALKEYTEASAELARKRGIPFVAGDATDPVGAFIRGLTGAAEGKGEAFDTMRATVREKHRLWQEYWRPPNWKCIFGDDSRRIFSKASHGRPSIQDEWATYPRLIEAAEEAIRKGEGWEPPAAPELTGSPEADIGKELESFEVLDGFEVNLFADESHGVRNPLSLRWDASGRMLRGLLGCLSADRGRGARLRQGDCAA